MVKRGLSGYVLGLLLLLPSAMLMVACWMCPCLWLWKRLRGREGSMLKADNVTRVRQNVSVEFTIPEQVVGFVIGRKGSSVKQVEAESGARVQFKELKGSTDKVVVISGRPSCVQAAQELVQQAVDDKLTSTQNQQMLTVTIPRKAVGRIIGRHGANIRSLQRESGAKITMMDGSRSDSVRTCEVIGTPEQLTRAVALVQEMVSQSDHRGSSVPPLSGSALDIPTQIAPLTLPSTTEFIPVFVSSIDGVGGVWIQPIGDEDPANLESLVEDMTAYYSNLQGFTGCPSNMNVGDVFAAPFEHDSSWYRVQVTGVSSSTCELLYLDYGDYGSTDMSVLRELRPEHYRLRSQSIRCILDSVLPNGGVWSEAALQCLEETTHSAAWKVLMLRILSREGIPKVQIIDTSSDKDIDVADQLVGSGHAHWANPHPPYPHSLRYHRDGEKPVWNSLKHVPFPTTSESVFVCSVQNPDLMYIQPEAHQLALSQLCERLNAVYSHSTEHLETVNPGQLVAACFPHDNQWYRGQVFSFNSSDNSALLMYPDYGLMFCLPVQHLRLLRPEFCDAVFYAVPCSLSDIQPSGTCDWPEESCQFLRDSAKPGEWQLMYAKLAGYHSNKDELTIANITLRSPDESVSVNSQLVDGGLAEYKSRRSPEGGEECVDSEGGKPNNVLFNWSCAGEVAIAGSFTNWKEVKLKKKGDGGFETSVDIPQGTHEYKYLVDGAWQHDDSQPTAINSFGTFNNTLIL